MNSDKFWQKIINFGTSLRSEGSSPEPSRLMHHCSEIFARAADEFKATAADSESLPITVDYRGPGWQQEKGGPAYVRCFVINPFWVISGREHRCVVEFFLFPAVELLSFSRAETSSRLKMRLELKETANTETWFLGEAPLEDGDLEALVRGLFKDLIKVSRSDLSSAPGRKGNITRQSTAGLVKNLVTERHRLMSALVKEQENTKSRLAMEIHDSVIGDILFLRRSVLGERELTSEDVAGMLGDIADRLRSICADLAPRDLSDWGLPTMLRDLVKRYSERTECLITLNCPDELPEVPPDAQMHIYRIVQESLTNSVKHARANEVIVSVECDANVLTFSVKDDGIGFDPDAVESEISGHHFGALILRERTELISTQLPASISVETAQGQGTAVRLTVQIAEDS